VNDKFALMHAEKADHSIGFMATLLQVSRAGYYAWLQRRGRLSPASVRRAAVTAAVIGSHAASDGVNGHRRVHVDLVDAGVRASPGMVRTIMRREQIAGAQPRARKRTTIPADDAEARPDLLRRDFTADRPGTKLVGDITYLRTGEGWLYLATVIDLHSRMVVGWAMAPHMRTELISSALKMAHTHGHVAPRAIFHSDRGSQYTSAEYAATAKDFDVRLSVGRTGSCLDNAVAESWFSMLKNEMYHRRRFATRAQARFHVMQYIEVFYNRRRRHSTLGYRTPADVHDSYQPQAATAA
jgi:putative transposase